MEIFRAVTWLSVLKEYHFQWHMEIFPAVMWLSVLKEYNFQFHMEILSTVAILSVLAGHFKSALSWLMKVIYC